MSKKQFEQPLGTAARRCGRDRLVDVGPDGRDGLERGLEIRENLDVDLNKLRTAFGVAPAGEEVQVEILDSFAQHQLRLHPRTVVLVLADEVLFEEIAGLSVVPEHLEALESFRHDGPELVTVFRSERPVLPYQDPLSLSVDIPEKVGVAEVGPADIKDDRAHLGDDRGDHYRDTRILVPNVALDQPLGVASRVAGIPVEQAIARRVAIEDLALPLLEDLPPGIIRRIADWAVVASVLFDRAAHGGTHDPFGDEIVDGKFTNSVESLLGASLDHRVSLGVGGPGEGVGGLVVAGSEQDEQNDSDNLHGALLWFAEFSTARVVWVLMPLKNIGKP